MDNGRADALLQWVNSVTGSNVQSFTEFSNTAVDVLVEVFRLIDKDNDNIVPNDRTIQDKISYMVKHLQGIYHCTDNIISSKSITEGNKLEIGKFISLLLCGAVQGNNVSYFIERIHQLENKIQYHLKAIIETLVCNMEKGELNVKSFNKLLQEKETFKDGQQFINSPGPVFSPSFANSPAETVYSNSPFMTLMLSPQMKNKQNQFITNKLHQKVKKLEIDLDSQQHIQATLEEELADKNKEIDVKGTKIRELQKELVQVKMIVDELESLQHFKNDYEKAEREIHKLKQRVDELENFKQQNANLDERTENFLKEKDVFEKQTEETELIKARCERYRQQAHHLEFQASELQAALHRREEEMVTIIKERDEALNAASESTELWRSRRLPEPEAEDEECDTCFDDSLMPMDPKGSNQESRLIELEFQNERLQKQLAASIDPEQLQQYKDRLDDVERSKKSYEEKFVEAKSKILALEDNLAQVQDQSRIRQEALQRKINDSDKMLNTTKEKLEQSRQELSRVQSELMLSRGEVEAHVIAMEKQRVTTSKAMDDMAAERKASEEDAEQKLYELRKELETKERHAVENCDRMSKEFDSKLRHVTEELQTIHKKDREEMQQKFAEISKQKDNLKTEFSTKQKELQQLVEKAEKETVEVRDVYENMLAQLKHELEIKIKKNEELTTAFNTTSELLQQKTTQHDQEKNKLNEAISHVEENVNQLMQENGRLNEDIERLVQTEKDMIDNEYSLKKEIKEYELAKESLMAERNNLGHQIKTLEDSKSKLQQEKDCLESEIISAKERETMLLEEKALEISTLKLEYTTELESIIEKFENENKTSVLEMKKVHDELSHKIKEADEKISKLNEETEDKINCIESMKVKLRNFEEEKQQLKKCNEEMNKQAKASEEEVLTLKAEKEVKLKELFEEMAKKDELFKQDILQLKADHENKEKVLSEEMAKKNEAFEQNIAILKADQESNIKMLTEEMAKKHEYFKKEITQLKAGHERELQMLTEEMTKKEDTFEQEVTRLKAEHENKTKILSEEQITKEENAKQVITQMKNESENNENELKKQIQSLSQHMSEQEDTSRKEIANRDKSLEELTQSFTKLKHEMDATEVRLLDITRERNELEEELSKEKNVGSEKIEALSFQKEQMKAEHSKVVQEMIASMQEERKCHKKEKKDLKDQVEKACHGLKVAADNIEEFKATIEELEQNVTTEKSRVKTLEVELDKLREDSKGKQKKIFEEAAKKNGAMEQAYETDRNNLKKKLEAALEENTVIRSEMFENSQKHSTEMMELKRHVQETEDRAAIEERKLREEIRGFIGSLANERVTNNDLKEKVQKYEHKERELSQSLDSKDKTLNEFKEKLGLSENKEKELLHSLAEKDKMLQEKSEDDQAKEKARKEEVEKLRSEFEEEKNKFKMQVVEQIQEKTNEAEQLQQKVKEFQKKIEQMSVDFNKERETLKTEFQNDLQKQANSEDKHIKEIENLQNQIKAIEESKDKEKQEMEIKAEDAKGGLESEIKELKSKLQESSTSMKKLKEELESTTEERNKVVSTHSESEETWKNTESELKNKLTLLEDECKVLKEKQQSIVRDEEEVKTINELMEKLEKENIEIEEQLQEERATNRRLGTQVNSLEAQLKHADRTIRDQNRTLKKIQSQSDDVKRSNKQMLIDLEKVVPVEKVQDYLDAESSSTDEEPLMKIDELASGHSTTSFSSTNSSTSLNSLCRSGLRSTIPGRTAANRRQSAMYLKGNTPPGKRTTASAAYFVCDEFARDMEQEPLDYEYDWGRLADLEKRNNASKPQDNDCDAGRLAELERRNTICKPHMKTSYPIETQTRPDDKNKSLMSSISESGYRTRLKRKSEEALTNGANDPKLRKEQPNSKSEGYLKRSKSKRFAEKMTSKINSLRSKSDENIAKDGEKLKGGSTGNSVAFSIDITPPSKNSKDNSTSKIAVTKNKTREKETKSTESKANNKADSVAFTIDNSPPKKIPSELKPKRQRTINRSTASTRLVFAKDKEICKEAKKKEYLSKTNRKPLRSANTKKIETNAKK